MAEEAFKYPTSYKMSLLIAYGWSQICPQRHTHGVDIVTKSRDILRNLGMDVTGSKGQLKCRAFLAVQSHLGIKAPPVRKRKKPAEALEPQPTKRPSPSAKEEFYSSWEWTALRMRVLKEQGRRCLCCGAEAGDDVGGGVQARIVVDHIKPLSLHWDKRLDRSNLQVLCHICNKGKSNVHEDDFRAA